MDPGSVVGGGIRRIVREGQHLVLHGAHGGAYRLVMVSMDEAYVERRFPTRLMFTLDEAGRATHLLLDWPLGPPQACVRTP